MLNSWCVKLQSKLHFQPFSNCSEQETKYRICIIQQTPINELLSQERKLYLVPLLTLLDLTTSIKSHLRFILGSLLYVKRRWGRLYSLLFNRPRFRCMASASSVILHADSTMHVREPLLASSLLRTIVNSISMTSAFSDPSTMLPIGRAIYTINISPTTLRTDQVNPFQFQQDHIYVNKLIRDECNLVFILQPISISLFLNLESNHFSIKFIFICNKPFIIVDFMLTVRFV